MVKRVLRQLLPPVLLAGAKQVKRALRSPLSSLSSSPASQDLEVYWDAKMASLLETWGEENVWKEMQYFVSNCNGRVLDVACGTGRTIEINSRFRNIEIHGCDISDFLINKALARGIPQDRLIVCDATRTPYSNGYFKNAYSIGSLEHFTEDGIMGFLAECYRISSGTTFHMIPVSRSGRDEGWLKTYQSFYNNSVEWWLAKYGQAYENVYVLDSFWQDDISVGKWFVCERNS